MNAHWSAQSVNNIRSNIKHLPRRNRIIPRTRSILSVTDTKFVELTRCLYQAKTVVQDLSSFHSNILHIHSLSMYHDAIHSSHQNIGFTSFFQHIKQYLDHNFTKFTKFCNLFMMILSRLERNVQVKSERVQSFRNEIMKEWHVATNIKRQMQAYLQQNYHLFDESFVPPISSSTTTQYDFIHATLSSSIRQQEIGSESINSLL